MTIIIDSAAERAERLAAMGFREGWLRNAVIQGDAGASSSTRLHPPGDSGFRRWSDTTAALRAQVMPHNWYMSNASNYCTVFNRDTRIAVVVMAGDIFTGTRLGTPRSRYPKGIATEERIGINNGQQSMFPSMKSPREVLETDCFTYALVQYDTDAGIQVELSRPSSMSGSGYVNDWHERILLPIVDPRSPESQKIIDDTPDAPDVDFVVSPI